jgi:hypothetical protein
MIGMPNVACNISDLPNIGQSIGSCVIKDLQLQRHFLAQMVSLIDLLTCNGLCFKFSCNISPEVCLKVKDFCFMFPPLETSKWLFQGLLNTRVVFHSTLYPLIILLSVLHLIFLSFLLFSCMSFSFSFSFSLSSCIFGSSPSLLLRFCWVSQHHGQVAPSLPVIVTETQYVMFLTLISTAWSWWSQ